MTTVNNNSSNNNNMSSSSSSNSAATKEMIQRFQSKTKDMEQRLSAAILQQQQMSTTTTMSGKGNIGGGGTGISSSSSTNKNKSPQGTVIQQQQQQQQQISKHINRYRMVLCETYADWILCSPKTAVQYDIMNALWRSCFYGRIGPARIRIQKEQKKYDTLTLNQTTTTTITTNTTTTTTTASTIQAMATSIRQQKESLSLFLKEGITLYEYLCQTLQNNLIQHQSSSSSTTTTATDENMMNDTDENDHHHHITSSNGIVPCLYRLYIHLGDLHRYGGGGGDSNHNDSKSVIAAAAAAQGSYTKATQLGPAFGHAYNQLAVIYQVKDTTNSNSNNNSNSIATVYWYTRSLGASQEPFATAAMNLIRLFDSNRQWLQIEQGKQTKKILLRPGSSNNKNTDTNYDDNKTSAKLLSTNQSNTSRLCLANFVDVQYSFYTLAKKEAQQQQQESAIKNGTTGSAMNLQPLMNHIRTILTSIQELLTSASFSDSLLCKLITIMSFIEYHTHHYKSATTHNTKLRLVLRMMIYEFGTCMAQRVLVTLTNKILKQQQQQKSSSTSSTIPSIRVILPLLLITEYLLQNNIINTTFASLEKVEMVKDDYDPDEREQYNNLYSSFWKTIIDVYNAILTLPVDCMVNNNDNDTSRFELREYQELRGFAPFESFVRHSTDRDTYMTKDGYLSDSATIVMLEQTKNNNIHHRTNKSMTTQESNRTTSQASGSTNISVSSSTTNNSISNNKEMVLVKLRRFIALRMTLVAQLQRHVRVHQTTLKLEWVPVNEFYNVESIMQYNNVSNNYDVKNTNNEDDGGDYIIAMSDEDENNSTINPMKNVLAEDYTYASTTHKSRSPTKETNEGCLLMYQHDNIGPALLVPGALLLQSSTKTFNSIPVATTADPIALHPPGLSPLPPPVTTNTFVDHNVFGNRTLLTDVKTGSTITPPPGFAPAMNSGINHDLFMNSNADTLYSNANHWQAPYGLAATSVAPASTTIGESMYLFGGTSALHTSNPFASTTTNDARLLFDNGSSSLSHNYVPSYGSNNDTDMMFGLTTTTTTPSDDDPFLFNSGILKSLLMEETTTGGLLQQQQQQQATTKNPFA